MHVGPGQGPLAGSSAVNLKSVGVEREAREMGDEVVMSRAFTGTSSAFLWQP